MRDRDATCLHPVPRSARFLACALVAAVAVACARTIPSDRTTELTTRLAIGDDKPAVVIHDASAGAYLIEAREDSIDLQLDIVEPIRSTVKDRVPRHGLLAQVVRLDRPGKLRIEVRSADQRAKTGTVILAISRWSREIGSAPGERETGFGKFGAAGEQTARGDKESWDRTASLLNEAAAHFDAAGDSGAQAQALYTLGFVQYLERDDRAAAIRAAEQATALYQALDDKTGTHNATVLRAASELEIAAGMNAGTQRAEQRALFDAADRRLEAAASYFVDARLPVQAAYAVNMRGIRAAYAGDVEAAEKYFTQAVSMAAANNDEAERFKSLSNLAWIHNRRGFVAEAAREYSEMLTMVDRERQPTLYGTVLGNYGFCLVALGEFDRALTLHTEALQVFTSLGKEAEMGRQLLALSSLYLRTGDLQRSLEASRAAIEIQERNRDGIGLAAALRMAGNASSALDKHDVALQFLRQAAERDTSAAGPERTRVLVAAELRSLGRLREAEQELAPALASRNAAAHSEALDERGRLRLAQKDFAGAIEDLRAANQEFTALGLDFNRINTNTTLSQALLASGDVRGAVAAADAAIEIVGRIRVNSANPEWRALFLSARYSPYEARIAAELAGPSGRTPDAQWRALRIAEGVHARSLADVLSDSARQQLRAPDPEGDAMRAQLTSQLLRLDAQTSRGADEKDLRELRREIIETRARIDAHRLRNEAVAARDSTLPDSLRRTQAALPADAAVLTYFVGDETTYAWLVSRREFRHAAFGGRAEMLKHADGLVAVLRQSGTRPVASREIGAKVIGNLLDGFAGQRLLIIPDGPLNGLPFAALATDSNPGQVLVERFVLSYAPSLALAMRDSPGRKSKSTQSAVISDPVYAPDDRRLVTSIATEGVMRSPPPLSPNKLTRLPYSGLEARTVAKALGVENTLQLSGFDATPGQVLELASRPLSVLHFATHAKARADSPEQSALYLSEYSPAGKLLEDSQLSVTEIRRSGLHADVVVLSGCETGDGNRLRGEGVLGLTYGFLANGSQSVVASLWQIEDAATATFMNEFYRAYRETGRSAEALRHAQLRTRGSVKATVWSSFVVRANEFP
jgi:CHAT domain-containing protein